VSSKLNQVSLDREPHNPSGFAFAPSVIDTHDELTKRQVSLPAIGFHGPKFKPGNREDAMGCLPHMRFVWIQPPAQVFGLEGVNWMLTRRLDSDNIYCNKVSAFPHSGVC
jgi:hypothetical protein